MVNIKEVYYWIIQIISPLLKKIIESMLMELGYTYEKEKGFPGFKAYRYDFYIPSENIVIEVDGQQHYTGWGNSPLSLRENKKRDAIKNQFCIDNFIKILRIKYDKIDILTLEYLDRRIKIVKYLKVNTTDNLIAVRAIGK